MRCPRLTAKQNSANGSGGRGTYFGTVWRRSSSRPMRSARRLQLLSKCETSESGAKFLRTCREFWGIVGGSCGLVGGSGESWEVLANLQEVLGNRGKFLRTCREFLQTCRKVCRFALFRGSLPKMHRPEPRNTRNNTKRNFR